MTKRQKVSTVVALSLMSWNSNFAQALSAPEASFAEAYERIQKRNLNYESQRLTLESADAKKLASVGRFLPALSLVATDNRANTVATDARRAAALTLSANLFRSGTDLAALKASSHDVDSNKELLGDQRLKAEDDAATSLVNLITQSRERDLIAQIVGIKQESVKIAHERYAKGLLPAQEVDKTQIDFDNAQARLSDADVKLAGARATVSAKLGSAQAIVLDWPWKTAIAADPRLDVSDFQLVDRPDYRAIVQTLEAEGWRRHAARAGLLPSLDFSASYGSIDVSQTDRRDWSTMLTLTIPIFEGFVGWSAARVQALEVQQAEIRRETIVRNTSAEIESLSVNFRAARETAAARERTAKLTSRLFSDNLQRFRLGRASVDELSVDQNRLLDSQILEVEGWAAAHLSLVRLCHALGRSVLSPGVCDSF